MSSIEQGWRIGAESDTGSCLLIIGNGFDLHHGLATGYSDYHDWLVDHDEQVATDFETFCFAAECSDLEGSLDYIRSSAKGVDPRWCSLEESLGIEWDDLCYETLDHTYPDVTEDNPGWDDFWIELQMRLEYLKKLTRDHFREWVESIDVSKIKPALDLPDTASFVTFNYTPTLEYVYGVRPDRILHIHGCVLDKNELLQFGSPDNNPFELQKMLEDKYGMDDFYGATIQQGVTVACDRCADTRKNIEGNYDAQTISWTPLLMSIQLLSWATRSTKSISRTTATFWLHATAMPNGSFASTSPTRIKNMLSMIFVVNLLSHTIASPVTRSLYKGLAAWQLMNKC